MNNDNKLLQELHFTIGEQFELNEFNVKTEKSIIVGAIEYEIYTYIKEDIKSVFGLGFNSILLFYNADILSAIKYEFSIGLLEELVEKLYFYLPGKKVDNKIECKVDDIFLILKIKENCVELYVSKFEL